MPILTLTSDSQGQLKEWLQSETMLVACLCAAWCDVCRAYRIQFEQLAALNDTSNFVWIDIEDQADLVGDFEVDNFPTLLVQRGRHVTFFGSVVPGLHIAARLIQSQHDKTLSELAAQADASIEHQRWQQEIHLGRRLGATT